MELHPPDPERVALLPSIGRLALVGALAVLGPGIVVFAVCKLAGLGDSAAGGWGLLAMFLGLVWYPTYLRRLARRLPS